MWKFSLATKQRRFVAWPLMKTCTKIWKASWKT